jgi:hypothetical protein
MPVDIFCVFKDLSRYVLYIALNGMTFVNDGLRSVLITIRYSD